MPGAFSSKDHTRSSRHPSICLPRMMGGGRASADIRNQPRAGSPNTGAQAPRTVPHLEQKHDGHAIHLQCTAVPPAAMLPPHAQSLSLHHCALQGLHRVVGVGTLSGASAVWEAPSTHMATPRSCLPATRTTAQGHCVPLPHVVLPTARQGARSLLENQGNQQGPQLFLGPSVSKADVSVEDKPAACACHPPGASAANRTQASPRHLEAQGTARESRAHGGVGGQVPAHPHSALCFLTTRRPPSSHCTGQGPQHPGLQS